MNNFLQLLKMASNPQQFAYEQLKQMSNQNPMINSALSGNAEQVVRNICAERGINADALYNQVMNQFKR